jgi:hypothetical protein
MATDFLAEYKTKTNDELLRIVAELESLVPEARHALATVLKDRQLDSPATLAKFREEESERLQRQRTSMSDLVLVVPAGMGRRMYGKKNRVADDYDTTLFIVFLWFPLIPLGTYRIREASPRSFYVLDKKPLDWRQVLATWLKAGAVFMAICLVIRLLAYLA